MKNESMKIDKSSGKKNLFAEDGSESEDEDADEGTPIWLQLTTKHHIADAKRLKPGKM
jgi:hypothetical protein